MSDIRDQINDEMRRRMVDGLVKNVLENNALVRRIHERRLAQWAALPWHAKLRRRIKARCRTAVWRVTAAWRVLRTGDIE